MDARVTADPLLHARAMAELLEAAGPDIERQRRLTQPVLGALHDARLFRMLLPRSVGGDEVPPWIYLQAVEEVSSHDGSTGWCLFTANSSSLLAAYLPQDTVRTVWGDERAVVGWGPPNTTVADAVPGGYRISGRWNFASGCRHSTWMGAHGQVVEPDGTRRLNANGRPYIISLLFPTDRARLIDVWDTIGLRGTASDAYELDDLFVPDAFASSREDPSLRREPGKLYGFTMQGLYAVGATGVALGLARAMLNSFIEVARRKTPRGLGPLATSPTAQALVARATARLDASRGWLITELQNAYEANGPNLMDIPARARVRLACAHATEAAIEIADAAYKAAGTDAIFAGSVFERRFRDLHTAAQQTQARGAHFESVGAVMLTGGDVFW